mgnify:FL=1|jgi:hypothetical protein
MAVTLVGTVINTADAITGFNQGNISTDDDFVQGTGSIGLKASTGLNEIYTTTIASGPYNYNVGRLGEHIVMWFNTKTPISATGGLRIVVGNGTSRGSWNVDPRSFYKGGFVTAVVNTGRNFDNILAGSWTVGGNPAQLTNVTQVGGAFDTLTSIMGNFNNVQIDQFTTGFGVRVDAGTSGTPNNFASIITAENTNFWGWWSSFNGSNIGRGKIYIGPATGTATSWFEDSAFSTVFADSRVAVGFFEFAIRGANTTVRWNLANISAANPTNARWSLTIDAAGIAEFTDTSGVWRGSDTITLRSTATLNGTTLINGTSLIQNSATLSGITVSSANTATGVGYIQSNAPNLISNSSFTFSAGHAITITTPGTYTFTGNTFTGYGAGGTNSAAIYNNSGGAVTLNIAGGGGTPTVRNGAGASTTVVNAVSVRVTSRDAATNSPIVGARVYLVADTGGPATAGDVILSGVTNGSGVVENTGFAFLGNQPVTGRVRKSTSPILYKTAPLSGTITANGLEITAFQVQDQ